MSWSERDIVVRCRQVSLHGLSAFGSAELGLDLMLDPDVFAWKRLLQTALPILFGKLVEDADPHVLREVLAGWEDGLHGNEQSKEMIRSMTQRMLAHPYSGVGRGWVNLHGTLAGLAANQVWPTWILRKLIVVSRTLASRADTPDEEIEAALTRMESFPLPERD